MKPVVQFFTKLMVAVWLLATGHAVFEFAGVMHHEPAMSVGAGHERWHQVENTLTKQPTKLSTGQASATVIPRLLDLVRLFSTQAVERAEPAIAAVDANTRAVHTWHFVQRAAPLPGAPSAAV